jgi:hypothetical protein
MRFTAAWKVREVEPEPSARLCVGTANPSEGPMRAMREAEIPHNLDHEEPLELMLLPPINEHPRNTPV